MTRGRTWWVLALVVAALAVAASLSSAWNAFAYDDVYVVVNNAARMHTLDGWWREFGRTYWLTEGGGPGDGYRPFTILAFKAQWVLGAGNPMVFHVASIAVHTMTAVAVFWLAGGIVPPAAAWVAAAFYAVHPVHVEAIANVVGQSELAVGLLVTVAMGLYVHGRSAGPVSVKRWIAIAILFAAALLFKEHAITMLALVPLAEFTVVREREPWRSRLARLRMPWLVLVVIAVAYLWVRSVTVIGSGFAPFIVFQSLDVSAGNRVLTMIGAAPEWLRLLLWPARLMTEYAPPYIGVAQGPAVSQLPGLLVLLGVVGLVAATWRRSPATAFGIAWAIITLSPSSNFLLPAGFIIAERTLLLPSVGAMIAVASVVPWLYARVEHNRLAQAAGVAAVLVLVVLGTARSHARNPVWRNNETLFRQAVVDAPESYRAHFMLGTHLFEQQRKTEGERHYRIAMRLFPYDPLMAYALAEQYRGAGMCAPAIPLYEWYFELEPDAGRGHLGHAQCLLLSMRLDEARAAALRGIRAGARVGLAREIIAAARAAGDSMAARRARGDTMAVLAAPATRP
jgi:protein O-mannosyl-transferase